MLAARVEGRTTVPWPPDAPTGSPSEMIRGPAGFGALQQFCERSRDKEWTPKTNKRIAKRGRAKPLPELKEYYATLPSVWSSITSSAATYDVPLQIAQGLDSHQRIGKRIFVKDLVIDGTIEGGQMNVAADDNHNNVRVCAILGVPTTASTALNTSFSCNAMLTPTALPGLLQVKYDRMIELASPGRDSTGYMPALHHIHVVIPVNREIVYTTSAGSSVSGVSLMVCMVSDSIAITHPGCTYGQLRMRFYDL